MLSVDKLDPNIKTEVCKMANEFIDFYKIERENFKTLSIDLAQEELQEFLNAATWHEICDAIIDTCYIYAQNMVILNKGEEDLAKFINIYNETENLTLSFLEAFKIVHENNMKKHFTDAEKCKKSMKQYKDEIQIDLRMLENNGKFFHVDKTRKIIKPFEHEPPNFNL